MVEEKVKRSKIGKSLSLVAAVLLVTVVLLAACSPSKPTPQFKLRIGLFPVQDFLPYFVMQEQGFAKENGIQFEETSYPGGAAIIEAMAVSSFPDVSSAGTVPMLIAAERGLIPIKVVPVAANTLADPDHPHIAVLVAPSINNWKDLKGQLIAVNAINSLMGAALRIRLKQEGISDYKLVEIPLANMGLAVAGGNAAAANMTEPFLTQSLLRGDGKLLGWIIGGPPFERMQSTQIIFSADFYQSNRQAGKAFLRAHLEAVKWINQKPEGARSILAKRLNINKEVSQKIKLLHWPLDARNDPALLESMQPLLVDIGMLKTPIPARKLYDETLLEEVLKELK
jgi:NitT/TauT family transport system substrate-binding protein